MRYVTNHLKCLLGTSVRQHVRNHQPRIQTAFIYELRSLPVAKDVMTSLFQEVLVTQCIQTHLLNHINSISLSFYIYWKMRAAVFNCPRFWNSHGLQFIVCAKQRQWWNPRNRQPDPPTESKTAPVLNVEMGFGETWGVHSIYKCCNWLTTDTSRALTGFNPRNGVKDISEPAICISFAQ